MGSHMPEPNRHDDPKQWATCRNCGQPIFRRTWGDWMHESAFPGGSPGTSCRDGATAVPGAVRHPRGEPADGEGQAMSDVPEELVEKAGLAIRRGFGTAATDDGDVIYTDLIEDVAREALIAVLPDVRRVVAEEIAAACRTSNWWYAEADAVVAARIAREAATP